MTNFSSKIIARARNWPVIGKVVRISGALFQLPELRDRQVLFEDQQLPSVLSAISEINHRQLQSTANDDSNFAKSLPVALRKMAREIATLRAHLDESARATESRLPATDMKLDEVIAGLNTRLSESQHELSELDTRLSESRQELVGLSSALNYSTNRIEFVRRELMFEMRYGSGKGLSNTESLRAKTKIVSVERVAEARKQQLRLNIGCGHIPVDGYVNVDRRALAGVDIVSEAEELPFEIGEVDEIFSSHMLEHFPQEQLRRELLPYWKGLLKPSGKFRAVVPDAKTMIKGYVEGTYPYSDLREVTFGSQDYDGDFHYNMFTTDSLSELLVEAGFESVEVVAEGRRNGACFEFELLAINSEVTA